MAAESAIALLEQCNRKQILCVVYRLWAQNEDLDITAKKIFAENVVGPLENLPVCV